jgi:RNA polymerase sigma-70 factor (ECF subfamily)
VAVDDFDAFYRSAYPGLFRVLALLTGTREDAADLCQEAFGKAAESWYRVQGLDDPAGWVRRVAVNRAVDLSRRRGRQRRAVRRLAADLEPAQLDGLSVEVMDALRSLPFTERQVVVLHHLLSLTTSEIAQELSRPSGTVKAQLVRGRARLAQALRVPAEEART